MNQVYYTVLFAAIASLALQARTASGAAVTRTSVIKAELDAYNSQLTTSMRAEKYTEMAADAFAYFRGTNHIFWKDMGGSPSINTYGGVSNTRTWISGDAHVNNMGAFANDQNTIVFDLNDFDESMIADYQYDVWRTAISVQLMLTVNGGFSSSDCNSVIDAFTESYLDKMEDFASG
jgi:uncharacterized protein (DUF2252 family)